MRLAVLGPVSLVDGDDRPVSLGGPQRRALLVMLALARGKVVTLDQLVDGLWHDPPPSAVRSLQVHVSALRKALPPDGLQTHGPGYGLQPGAVAELDVDDFETLIAAGGLEVEQGRFDLACDRLREALSLWRGPALSDIADHPFAGRVIAPLAERRRQAVDALTDARLSLGEHVVLTSELEALVDEDPWREQRWGQLMLAYYRSDRQAEALAAYRRARAALVDGLGVEPGETLRRLEAAILAQSASLTVPPPARSMSAHRGARLEGWAPAEPRLVGREPELRRLVDALDALAAGRRPLIAIAGEPGIGKTRLAQELSDRAAARGALVAWGRCFDAEATAPYRPVVAAMRALIERLPAGWIERGLGAREADLAILLPELSRLVGVGEIDRPSGDERLRLFDSVVAFLRRVSTLGPVLIVFDDLHAADPSSVTLVEHLVRHIGAQPVLLVATFRTAHALDEPLARWLEHAQHERELEQITLEGLRSGEVSALLAALCGDRAAETSGADVAALTGGNPFFVRELAVHHAEQASGPPAMHDGLPESVLTAVDHRVVRLDPACSELLQHVAVTPGGAPLQWLMAASEGGSDVLGAVERGMRAGFLREGTELGTTIVDFAHPLFRQALLHRTGVARRADLHRRLAEVIGASVTPHEERWLGDLAFHTFAAGNVGDPAEVVRVCRRAGDAAMARTGFHDAVTHYGRALEAMTWTGGQRSADRGAIALACARAHRGLGDADAARSMAEAAFADADDAGDAGLMADAALVHAGARSTYGVVDERTRSLLQAARDALLARDDQQLMPHVLSRLAQESYIGRRYELAGALSAEAVEVARRGGDSSALAAALEGRVWALHTPETLAERAVVAGELVDCAHRAADREWLMLGLIWRYCARLEIGDIDGVDADLARLDEFADLVRAPSHAFRVATLRATRALMTGDYERGFGLAQEAYRVGLPIEPDNAEQVLGAQLLGMMREHDLLESVAPMVQEMAAGHADAPGWGCALAFVYAEADLVEEARAQLESLAVDRFAGIPRDLAWLLGFCYLAEAIAVLKDAPRAREVHAALLPYADHNAAVFEIQSAGSVAHFLGLLARTAGAAEQADAHFRQAIAFNDRTRQWPAAARSRYEYARLLSTAGDARAGPLLSEALASATRLGMSRLQAQVQAARDERSANSM